MDNITLFSIITVLSFFLLAPVAVFMEGVKFTPAYLQSAVSDLMVKIDTIVVIIVAIKSVIVLSLLVLMHLSWQGLNVKQVYIRSLLAALCFHAYQQVSIAFLWIMVHLYMFLHFGDVLKLQVCNLLASG